MATSTSQPGTSSEGYAKATSQQRKERFIPIARPVLIKALTQHDRMPDAEKRKVFSRFAHLLSTIMQARLGLLWDDLKDAYDLFDPDKDTIKYLHLNERQTKEAEERFVKLLESLINAANFEPLANGKNILPRLEEVHVAHGVKVHLDPSQYEYIRVWVRGQAQHTPRGFRSVLDAVLARFRGDKREQSQLAYRRSLFVYKTKSGHIHIKLFKDLAQDNLGILLPIVRIEMSDFDRNVFALTIASLCLGYVFQAYRVSKWGLVSPLLSAFGGIFAMAVAVLLRLWSNVNGNKNHYMARHNGMLFTHNIGDNRSAIALLLDRAIDEDIAESLLAFFFLETSPMPLTKRGLKVLVEDFMESTFRIKLEFDVDDALNKLDQLGLLRQGPINTTLRDKTVHVVPLAQAAPHLERMTCASMALRAKL